MFDQVATYKTINTDKFGRKTEEVKTSPARIERSMRTMTDASGRIIMSSYHIFLPASVTDVNADTIFIVEDRDWTIMRYEYLRVPGAQHHLEVYL